MRFDNKKEEPKVPEIPKIDWRDKYAQELPPKSFELENATDDSTLNRMIQLKAFDPTKQIQGKPGSLYFDKTNGKVKIFIDEATGWKNLAFEP